MIVLSTLNSKFIHSSLALRYLKAYGSAHGMNYEIQEYTINQPILDILSAITSNKPSMIGFACYIWNIEMTKHLAQLIKTVYPDIRIIFGGPEVSYTVESVLEACDYVDYIVQGEGEEAFYALSKQLLSHASLQGLCIPGVLGREDGRIVGSHQLAEVKDLNTIPFPYTEEDMADLEHRIIYYESSRGCPFHCRYCLSGNQNTVRFFDEARTLKELAWFVDHKVPQVKFVDRTFNCAPNHHLPLMKWIAAYGETTNFHLEMEGGLIGPEEVDLLSTAPKGRMQIEVGVQSTNPATLEAIHRMNDWDHCKRVLSPIIKAGRTHVHMDLIVGLPEEGYERFGQSFDDLFALEPQALQIGFLKLLRGASILNTDGFVYKADPKAPYEILETNVLPYEKVHFLKQFEDVFEQFYNSERYRRTFLYVGGQLLAKGQSAFAYFEEMTKAWLDQGLHKKKLRDLDRLVFLMNFFRSKQDSTAIELLRLDIAQAFKGHIRDEQLGLAVPKEDQRKESEVFWRQEDLVKQYIPTYQFTEWRRIRRDYVEIDVADKTIEALYTILPKDELVLLEKANESRTRMSAIKKDKIDSSKQVDVMAEKIRQKRYILVADCLGRRPLFIRPDLREDNI